MGVPKGKTTKHKKGSRRSHHKATTMAFSKCSDCGEFKLNHRVCPSCGKYNKKQVMATDEL